jgi:hypothetical protein
MVVMRLKPIPLLGVALAMLLQSGTAAAQMDLSGNWFVAYHEDWIEVGTGPDIADFTGLPLTDAARERSLSWNPSLINQLERQCAQLPLDYTVFWTNFRIWKEIDPFTQELIAYKSHRQWGEEKQTVWLDGRDRPPPYAQHTYQGFSTGEWDGDKLKITVTHLKEGYSRRNGVPRSDRATMIIYYIRHDDHLTIARIVKDPDYLTEPLIHTTNYTQELHKEIPPWKCETVTELVGRAPGYVPHYFPWKNEFAHIFAQKYHIATEAAWGGARTMYPDYLESGAKVTDEDENQD